MNPKKCLTFLLSLCLLFCVTVQASAEEKEQSEEKVLISSLSSEECTEKLSELGVAIPRELNGINIQEVVAAFEADPEFYSVVNYTVANDFFKDVRHAINRYHDWPDKVYDTTASTSYTLQYSTLYSWNSSTMPYYNCYAYAIGRSSACNPGDFSGQSYNHMADISTVASIVKDDLKGQLGYKILLKEVTFSE